MKLRDKVLSKFKIGDLKNPVTLKSIQEALEYADIVDAENDNPNKLENIHSYLDKKLNYN